MPSSREYPLDNSVNEMQDGAMSMMSVEDARKSLEQAMNSAIIWRNGDGVAEKVDALITAIRAETLAPATRVQSAEQRDRLARVEKALASVGLAANNEGGNVRLNEHSCASVREELARLRAALAAAELALADVRASKQQSCCNEARVNADRVATLEAENAELRKLCERTANGMSYAASDASVKEEHLRGLLTGMASGIRMGVEEAAARRAGK